MMGARSLKPNVVLRWMADSFIVLPDAGQLVWKSPPKNHPRMKGLPAGSPRPARGEKQYIHVKKDRLAIKRGWLIFLWMRGRWPSECLDHIDGDSTNDSIKNLREATITQNAWNHKGRARRIQLPMGVRHVNGRYQARIALNKKMIYLGVFDTAEEAQAVYAAKRKELYREFA